MEIKQIIEGPLPHNHFLQNYNSGSLTDMSSMVFLLFINPKEEWERGGQPEKERGKKKLR